MGARVGFPGRVSGVCRTNKLGSVSQQVRVRMIDQRHKILEGDETETLSESVN